MSLLFVGEWECCAADWSSDFERSDVQKPVAGSTIRSSDGVRMTGSDDVLARSSFFITPAIAGMAGSSPPLRGDLTSELDQHHVHDLTQSLIGQFSDGLPKIESLLDRPLQKTEQIFVLAVVG